MPVVRTRPLVLNVDDDAANRYVKTRSLRLGEMEVIEAETGDRRPRPDRRAATAVGFAGR